MNRIKVCRVSTSYPRQFNPGSGLVAYYLSKYGKAQTLFITRRQRGTCIEVPPNVILKQISYPEFRMPANPNLVAGVTLKVFKFISYTLFFLKSVPYLIRFKPDIIHIHTPIPLLHGVFGKVFLRAKLVLTLHGTDFYRLKSEKLIQWSIRKWVDSVFFVSKAMYGDLKRLMPGKRLVYTPNGVDRSRFFDQGKPRKKQLVAVGTLKWQKGYEYLLESVKQVFIKHPDYRLVIIGDGPLRKTLVKLANGLGLSGKVCFLGKLTHDEIAAVLNESSIFVLSSVYEGFPKALVEAIACGTPVVVTDVGSCRDIVDGAGLIVKPRDPPGFAEAINKLIEDKELRTDFSRKCSQLAERYSWGKTLEIVQCEYMALLHRPVEYNTDIA